MVNLVFFMYVEVWDFNFVNKIEPFKKARISSSEVRIVRLSAYDDENCGYGNV